MCLMYRSDVNVVVDQMKAKRNITTELYSYETMTKLNILDKFCLFFIFSILYLCLMCVFRSLLFDFTYLFV